MGWRGGAGRAGCQGINRKNRLELQDYLLISRQGRLDVPSVTNGRFI